MLFGSLGGDTRMMNTSKTDRDVSAPPPVDEQIARIIEQAQEQGLQLTGEGGLLPDMIKAAVEAALRAEMADHLGYDRHDRVGRGSGNSRNGLTAKTVQTTAGPVGPRCRGTVTGPLIR